MQTLFGVETLFLRPRSVGLGCGTRLLQRAEAEATEMHAEARRANAQLLRVESGQAARDGDRTAEFRTQLQAARRTAADATEKAAREATHGLEARLELEAQVSGESARVCKYSSATITTGSRRNNSGTPRLYHFKQFQFWLYQCIYEY